MSDETDRGAGEPATAMRCRSTGRACSDDVIAAPGAGVPGNPTPG